MSAPEPYIQGVASRPTALKEVIAMLGGEAFPNCQSPSLRLEKFVRLGGNTKKEEISAVVACHGKHARRIAPLTPAGAISFSAALGARLIVNQAGGVLENAGLCLHRHFGDPYLPGSAVKGVARHTAWCEWRDEPDSVKKIEIAQNIVRVFGYPTGNEVLDSSIEPDKKKRISSAGSIAFLLAVPESAVALTVDIVNCHHPKYYDGQEQDAYDNESPNPQFFPVVEQGTEFRFCLSALRRFGSADERDRLLGLAKAWLITGITLHGAGAKTAAGYGWFVYDAAAEDRKCAQEEERQVQLRAAAERRELEEQQRLANAEQKARESQMTPEERADAEVAQWNDNAFGNKLQRFHDTKRGPTDPQRTAMIRALRDDRLPLWLAFKAKATKGDLANAASAVYKTCKDMGMGKMPS